MNYTHARRGYLEWYSHLLSPYETGEEQSIIEVIEDRIDGLNLASEELTKATLPYLSADDHRQRITALGSLLGQIEGDLQVANALWNLMENAAQNQDLTVTALVRPIRESRLLDTLRSITVSIPPHIETPPTSHPSTPNTISLETALEGLRVEIEDAFDLILERADNVGIRLIRDILLTGQSQWEMVEKGVSLLQGHERVGDIGWGLEDEVEEGASELAGELRGVLINIMEKILAILEKNDLVRYTIMDWLDDLRRTGQDQIKNTFSQLVEHLYQTQEFRQKKLPIWLKDALDVEHITAAVQAVKQLEDDFEKLSNQIRLLGSIMSESTLFDHRLLASMGFGLRIGLLSTVVFAGYDHLDEGTRALNITRGIKQILIEDLPISAQTLEMAENLSARTIR